MHDALPPAPLHRVLIRRHAAAVLALAALLGLQGCGGAGGAIEGRRGRLSEDDKRPIWMPPPQERYPGYRLPDDGFRDLLARVAPRRTAGRAPAPS
jgi:hypothetical protein